MSSIIPKIAMSAINKRSKINLSQDTSTTTNFGFIQPTFCREIVPNSHIDIQTSNLVRLSPLFVPTLSKMSLRHYHCFVPYNTIYFPFDALYTGTNYTYPDGSTAIPSKVPHFTNDQLWETISSFEFHTPGTLRVYNDVMFFISIYDDNGISVDPTDSIAGDICADLFNTYSIYHSGFVFEKLNGKSYYYDSSLKECKLNTIKNYPSLDSCDISFRVLGASGNFTVCCNFGNIIKRIRKVLLGLGYPFNPHIIGEYNALKLLAYYKAYYTVFGITRTSNFNNTYCYKLIKVCSETNPPEIGTQTYFKQFLESELSQTWYVLPLDYYSMGDTTTQRGSTDRPIYLQSGVTSNVNIGASSVSAGINTSHYSTSIDYNSASTAIQSELALKLLRFVNRQSVIGKKVSDILRSRFGISDEHNKEHEECIFIGSSKTDIQVTDVISTAETKDGANGDVLGSYAGRGIGYGENEKFYLDTKDKVFGCLITLTVVVPDRNGYFQGLLRENKALERFDFYNPEFDALGYQALTLDELYMQDMNIVNTSNPSVFNYVPRYSHLKVSKNIVNGDLSRNQTAGTMLPYVLDRRFYDTPSNNMETFRLLGKYDQYGDYNRIFNYNQDDSDHFIIHTIFNVQVTSPMKSLETSWDTIDEDVNNIREFQKS